MKKRTKALVLVMTAVLLVAASVFGTMAYLTSQDSVTNTFTVGKVAITLDEAKVNENGEKLSADDTVAEPSQTAGFAARVKENTYKLMPNHSYTKDPTVHVEAGSEDCYLFVKLVNPLENIITSSSNGKGILSIEQQIELAYGWTQLTGTNGVYYRTHAASGTQTDYQVFRGFTILDTVLGGEKPTTGAVTGASYLGDYENSTITVTAYAVQQYGFANAAAAWAETFGKTTTEG